MMRRAIVRAAWVLVAASLVSAGSAGDDAAGLRREEQAALKAYGPLVGSWRGTGQPQRGRSAGSWTESASVAWKLSADSAALEIDVAKGKYLKSALLKAGPKPGEYVLDAILPDGSKRSFAGKGVAGKPLVLTDDGPAEGLKRVTLTIPNDLRFLLLLESAAGEGFARLGEVGFTRNGVAFAAGEAGPICIVTEGRGTIPVTHAGQTYYVCCSGCKDLFNQDPAAIIAEAEARKAKAGK